MSGEKPSHSKIGVRRKADAAKGAAGARDKAGEARAKTGVGATVLTVLFVVAAALVGWFGARNRRVAIQAAMDETASLRREAANMRTVIAGRDETLKTAEGVLREHEALAGSRLEPLLGSYAVRAKTLLEGLADATGLNGVQFADVTPHALLPAVPEASRDPYVMRSVRVTAHGSYQRLVSFLCRVERTMPMVFVDSVSISSEFNGTAQQRGVFVFTWLSEREGEVKP